ncbi:type II secretion system protein GspK [Bradyrhizobium prioriisuperbiae]|uniref:general secretion pathway protein GspK n=1 Tax=Bradyrhizobium prioriisuperbiae TaxID=2854389 RepID=UPI0028EEA2E0|nr:type II secretion system protein GspK [Bradyrhizobium prioritasuperba]
MSSYDSRRGMILFTVLWAIAFCSALAMSTSTTFRGLTGIVTIDRDRVQADALLSAGLEAAAGIAGAVQDAPLTERGTTLSLSTGSVRVNVSDEGGRIDIGKAPVALLASLLRYVGADDDDADIVLRRILDLRGTAQQAQTGDGPKNDLAKNGLAQRQADGKPDTPAAAPSPAVFTDVRQLAGIPGMKAEWLAAIAPLITVFGSDGVNPLTAPVAVIRALPFVDEARLEAFLSMRRQPLVDPERLAFLLGPAQKYLKAQPTQVIAVDLVASTTDGYTAAAKAFIVLLSDDKQPYRVLAWNPVLRFVRDEFTAQLGAR